jgi:hypothetical protein
VVDHHDRVRAKKPLAEQERANGVVACDATRVTNQVHLTEVESERAKEVKPGVHAREYRELQSRGRREFAVSVRLDVRAVV